MSKREHFCGVMDHKAWLWKKKSAEKTIANDRVDLPLQGNNEQQVQAASTDKSELEKELKHLTDKLSYVLSECHTKDELVKKHEKMAQEAIAGWEQTETEVVSLEKRLEESLKERLAGEERVAHLDAALKECMRQLHFVREEQEKRIHDAVMKTSKEFEKSQVVLEGKLEETNKRLAKMGIENTHLSKSLVSKEKLVEDLNKQRKRAEADIGSLMARLESSEKDNASLKYEVRILEKELEIRNEEREFNRRTADVSHKQHLESAKKIAKLESECQRLRLLVRKRLPGPAAVAKMKNEVDMLGRDSARMRKTNTGQIGSMSDFAVENCPETPSKRISILTEQLIVTEEENKTLREALSKKESELHISRVLNAQRGSKLSQIDSQVEGSLKGQKGMELTRTIHLSHEPSLASVSDIGSDDKVSCAESWATALISELENFRSEKQRRLVSSRAIGASDISLMDDFVEMEKLAIVSTDDTSKNYDMLSQEASALAHPLETNGKSGFCPVDQEAHSNGTILVSVPEWLQQILKVILEQHQSAERHLDEILEDVRIALAHVHRQNPGKFGDTKERASSNEINLSKPSNSTSRLGLSHKIGHPDFSSMGKSNQKVKPDLSKSMSKIIELMESISLPSQNYEDPDISLKKERNISSNKSSETPTGYMVRVFQWKTSELGDVLKHFLRTCYDLLNEKADLCNFFKELASALEWVLNHCFSLQDVSSMRDEIMQNIDWDESRSEDEVGAGIMHQLSDADKLHNPIKQLCIPSNSVSGNDNMAQLGEFQSDQKEEKTTLEENLEKLVSAKESVEGQLQSAVGENESLINQLEASKETIESLHMELNSLKESKGLVEDQIVNRKLSYEDLDRRLAVAKVELNEARQQFSSLEVELENKSSCCDELEATCLDLQLQLQSTKKVESPKNNVVQEGKQLPTNWEITAASERLAECQETILNLGKQLKALAPPKDAALFDKIVLTPTDANSSIATDSTRAMMRESPKNKSMARRSSLLDKMLAEDNANATNLKSSEMKGENSDCSILLGGLMEPSMAITPVKKRGGGSLWRKLLWRKRRVNSKKSSLPFDH
ncbi:filament-like plant protein 7 isoform X1 [Syzygium oleosum]|uniref:filament-like plant protein 7 isoform X1 n=2 Tax=Syzygium oleosum TaxID=219896 RepID=UPI0024BACACB|nr:filament-like plant protein 7 isoform X1 [Syzygium oleosum]